jgi:thiamine transport system substrate-binding protein
LSLGCSGSRIFLRITLQTLLAFSLFLSCSCRKQSNVIPGSKKTGKALNILTLNRISSSGFLKQIIPAFEQANNCRVVLTSCPSSAELLKIVHNEKELRRYDLVVGLDNCFLNGPEDYALFVGTDVQRKHPANPNYLFDKSGRIIPYGYGYLAILYNETKVNPAPESFGELQDSRFLNQMVVCDPRTSGIGRATLLWTIALFGNQGYQQFWKSVKKNIYTVKDSWQEALDVLQTQTCGMTFGFTGTPALITETQTNPAPIQLSLLQEGSFLYVEAAAIPRKAKRKNLAEAFLISLLAPDKQSYVAYDLGLFPVNDSAPLPTSFSAAPYTAIAVNDQLRQENPSANLDSWLKFWDRLFSHNLY